MSNCVHRVQLVEDLALDLLAGDRAELAFDLAADDFAQAVDRFEAELRGELVVDLERSAGAATSLTVTSKVASLPARWAAG